MALGALTVGATWVGLRLLPVVLAIIAALFLVGTLSPAAEWLEGRGMKRKWGIALVFTALFVAAVLLAVLTVPSLIEQVSTLARQEPAIRNHIADSLSRSRFTWSLAESLRHLRYDALGKASAEIAFAYSTKALEFVAYCVSSVFLALYVMIDRDRLRAGLFATVPRRYHVRLSRVVLNLETIVGGYIRGQVLTSALMALFTFVLLTIVGVSSALALAVFAGLADVLPYVGVLLSVGPVVVAVLAKGPTVVLVVTGAMLAYEEFESRVLIPRIYGRALRLSSSVVLVSLLAGGTLMGIVGVLLALPAAAAIRMLIQELRVELPGEEVDDPSLRARDDEAEQEYERRAHGLPTKDAAEIAAGIAKKCEEGDRAQHPSRPSDELLPLSSTR
jgi:predicted PurR-regulated permease PerM